MALMSGTNQLRMKCGETCFLWRLASTFTLNLAVIHSFESYALRTIAGPILCPVRSSTEVSVSQTFSAPSRSRVCSVTFRDNLITILSELSTNAKWWRPRGGPRSRWKDVVHQDLWYWRIFRRSAKTLKTEVRKCTHICKQIYKKILNLKHFDNLIVFMSLIGQIGCFSATRV